MIYLTADSENVLDTFDFSVLKEIYDFVKNLFAGVKDFFASFEDIFYVLFPYFTDEQVIFFVTVITLFMGVAVYLFFRRLTI